MTTFTVATWNVNSLKIRLSQVLEWLGTVRPNVLGIQELKLPTEDFPVEAFRKAGYEAIVNGQKTWNGVAFLVRHSLFPAGGLPETSPVTCLPGEEDPQRRVLAVTLGGMRMYNLYIPNGQDPASPKYQYKLDWLQRLNALIAEEKQHFPRMLLLGDFNIAPQPEDVYDPVKLEGQIHYSQPERAAFQALLDSGFGDCFRLFSQPRQAFSWWDYRLNAYKRNMGLRIDHILASCTLLKQCQQCYIDQQPRRWERPSDHTPVVAVFSEA